MCHDATDCAALTVLGHGFCYSGAARPADQEVTAVEEVGCYARRTKRREHSTPWGAPMEKHLGRSGGRDGGGACVQEPFWWLLWEGTGDARRASSGLAGLDNGGRIPNVGIVPSCVVSVWSWGDHGGGSWPRVRVSHPGGVGGVWRGEVMLSHQF